MIKKCIFFCSIIALVIFPNAYAQEEKVATEVINIQNENCHFQGLKSTGKAKFHFYNPDVVGKTACSSGWETVEAGKTFPITVVLKDSLNNQKVCLYRVEPEGGSLPSGYVVTGGLTFRCKLNKVDICECSKA